MWNTDIIDRDRERVLADIAFVEAALDRPAPLTLRERVSRLRLAIREHLAVQDALHARRADARVTPIDDARTTRTSSHRAARCSPIGVAHPAS